MEALTPIRFTALEAISFSIIKEQGICLLVLEAAVKLFPETTTQLLATRPFFANVGGYANAAFGAYALSANQNLRNTAIGFSALRANTLGESNTACGANALRINLVGIVNTAVGTDALFGNQNGDGNTAIGYGTLMLNNSSYNTAVGLDALRGTTASQYNTAVGMYAARQYNAGWNNTIIGAEADISFSGLFNGIALGNLAKVTDNSRVRIGNSANWSYEAFANWTNH